MPPTLPYLSLSFSYGAPVPEEPMKSFLPSGNVMSLALAVVDPSFAPRPPALRFTLCLPAGSLLPEEADAVVVEQLQVAFDATVQNHPHFPRARKDLGVLDGGFVGDVSGIGRREPLDDVQRIAVEVARA